MMIKESKENSKHANPPLSFDDACRRYVEWVELEAAKHGKILYGVPKPSTGLSVLVGSTWYLRNINGPLARIGANGRVWRPSSEDN